MKELILNHGLEAFSREKALAEMEKRIAREAAAQAERSFQAHFNNYAIRVSFGIPTHLKNSRIIYSTAFFSQRFQHQSRKQKIK